MRKLEWVDMDALARAFTGPRTRYDVRGFTNPVCWTAQLFTGLASGTVDLGEHPTREAAKAACERHAEGGDAQCHQEKKPYQSI